MKHAVGRKQVCGTKRRNQEFETEKVLENAVEPTAHLMSDAAKAFVAVGQKFAAHDTINHRAKEYVRGSVHANSAEGFSTCNRAPNAPDTRRRHRHPIEDCCLWMIKAAGIGEQTLRCPQISCAGPNAVL